MMARSPAEVEVGASRAFQGSTPWPPHNASIPSWIEGMMSPSSLGRLADRKTPPCHNLHSHKLGIHEAPKSRSLKGDQSKWPCLSEGLTKEVAPIPLTSLFCEPAMEPNELCETAPSKVESNNTSAYGGLHVQLRQLVLGIGLRIKVGRQILSVSDECSRGPHRVPIQCHICT